MRMKNRYWIYIQSVASTTELVATFCTLSHLALNSQVGVIYRTLSSITYLET
jgi:hypothetical protein